MKHRYTKMAPKASDKKITILLDRLEGCCGNSKEQYESLKEFRSKFLVDEVKQRTISFLEAIGNHERFLILESLMDQARCVCELEILLQKSQPTISHHLRILEKQRLIVGMKKGKFTFYTLVRKPFEEISASFLTWTKRVKTWFGEDLI